MVTIPKPPSHGVSLARYVPALTLRQLAANPTPLESATTERLDAAVLFADISGFSQLAERLAAEGAEGVETISSCLNNYFGQLIELVAQYGGDVLKFAGDALLAIWPADANTADDSLRALRLAAQCSLEVQSRLHDFQVRDDVRMSVRIVVDAGPMELLHLGGELGRWESLVRGGGLDRMGLAAAATRPGDVVVPPGRLTELKPFFQTELGPEGVIRLTDTLDAAIGDPAEAPELEPDALIALRSHLPGVVLSRVSAGLTDWLGELRRLSVVFITLPNFGTNISPERLQEVVSAIQRCVYKFDGSINKIAADEKGALLVAAFGLPPLSHPDDPTRAVRALLLIKDWFEAQGLPFQAGVTTGRAFCGSIGNTRRAEYTMIGDVVNLSARLMQASNGQILCDAATVALAREQLGFTPATKLVVRGRSESVDVSSPTGEMRAIVRPRTAMVGREQERTWLSEAIQDLVRKQEDANISLVGDAGIGKSRLLDEVVAQARTLGVLVFHGVADAIERTTPFHAWRAVFIQLFDLQSVTDVEARRAVVARALRNKPQFEGLAPLLNVVLPLDLKDTPRTQQMFGEVRANNTNRLLAELLSEVAGQRPTLLIMEDAHWFDSASWATLQTVRRLVSPMLLVVGTRPIQKPWPQTYTDLLVSDITQVFLLSGLSPEETGTLVRQRLGVRSLPDEVRDLISERSEGNALYSEELAYALRDSGHIVVDGDECRLGSENLASAALPDSIHTLVTSRVDRLPPDQQLALKVASVVGRTFDTNLLSDVFPVSDSPMSMSGMLDPLVEKDLIRPHGQSGFIFKHVMTQEAVYNTMLFAQRRELHTAVADWYEDAHSDDLSPYYPLLAHHWHKAEESPKAIDYFERAGQQALRRYANREAAGFYEQAVQLEKKSGGDAKPARYAHWERNLAEARFRLGDLQACTAHGGRALGYLGWPVPSSTAGRVFSLLRQLVVRGLQRGLPGKFAVS
ncbi:MAG: class 3 adenylate cyclase, partial [Myxococcota bacterium]